jgi:hypothetical protein
MPQVGSGQSSHPRALSSPVPLASRIAFSPDGRLDAAGAGARGNIRFEIWLLRLSVRTALPGIDAAVPAGGGLNRARSSLMPGGIRARGHLE